MEELYVLVGSIVESLPTFLLVVVVTVGAIFSGYYGLNRISLAGKRLPPGSLGLPLLGETISFLNAQKSDRTQEWLDARIKMYGPIFKASLIGKPTIVITGSSGNRFIFTADENTIASNPVGATTAIMGKFNIFELSGKVHKMMRGAIASFLTPESLHRYVGEMDAIIKQQLFRELSSRDSVKAVPLLKMISYNVACAVLFTLPVSKEQDLMFEEFTYALKGMWALPLNLPYTNFHRAMRARKRIYNYFSKLIIQQTMKCAEEGIGSGSNVISKFANLKDENGEKIPHDMIIDNMITLMIGSHDTNTIVLSQLVRLLARNKEVYQQVSEEHERILSEKEGKDGTLGTLSWNDLQKMKYTWRIAQEVMRITPPVFGNFRRAIRDTSFGGFDIPKGWQVFWVASATHMDKNIFPEPHKFDPSRFEANAKSYPPYCYIPFGAGYRICPGTEFARMEILIVMHHLIVNYEWSEMIPDEPITRDPMPYPAMGLPIKLRPKRF